MLGNRQLQKLTRFFLAAFALLFILFWLNVLLGKARISFGWELPFLLGDVAEYLLLLATALFFTLAAIGREAMVNRKEAAASLASGTVDD
jgi:hypothetical protein